MDGGTFCHQLCNTCTVKRVALDTVLWQTTFLDELPQNTHLHCLLSPLQNKLYPPRPPKHNGESKPHGSVNQENVLQIAAVTAPGKLSMTLVHILTGTNFIKEHSNKEARQLTINNT